MKKIGFSGLALLFCIYVYSMDTIKISRSDLKTNHLEHIHMYVVSNTNTEPVESIIKKQDLFRPIPASDLNFGIANNDYWFSFCLTNTSDTFRIMILSIKNPMLNHIQLYERSSCHIIKSITTGEMYPFSSRDIWNRFFLFRIELKPGETKQIFFKVANNGDSVFIPISLETEKTAFNEVEKDYLFNTFYYGFFLFLLVFNLLLLLTLKNKIFLSYMLYITCTLFFFMNNDGLSFQLFWPDSPWWGNQSFNIFIGIGGYYFLVFTQKFFDTRKNFPAMHTVIMVIRVLQLILVPFFFVSYPLFLHFSLILSFFTPVGFMITIVLAIIAIRRNMLFAKYVLVAYSV